MPYQIGRTWTSLNNTGKPLDYKYPIPPNAYIPYEQILTASLAVNNFTTGISNRRNDCSYKLEVPYWILDRS